MEASNELFVKMLNRGTWLYSSGTTGAPKPVWQSSAKIKQANSASREVQGIEKDSSIFTVCNLNHAGGLLAQTLPALEIGATVTVSEFNAREWIKDMQDHTHSHLTPRMADLVTKSSAWKEHRLDDKVIMCGSEPVPAETINKFTAKGATLIANWGMSEIGPVAINKVYKPGDTAEDHNGLTILGDQTYCDWVVDEGELWVKGDICVYQGWYPTGDMVEVVEGVMYYNGRKPAPNLSEQ